MAPSFPLLLGVADYATFKQGS